MPADLPFFEIVAAAFVSYERSFSALSASAMNVFTSAAFGGLASFFALTSIASVTYERTSLSSSFVNSACDWNMSTVATSPLTDTAKPITLPRTSSGSFATAASTRLAASSILPDDCSLAILR